MVNLLGQAKNKLREIRQKRLDRLQDSSLVLSGDEADKLIPGKDYWAKMYINYKDYVKNNFIPRELYENQPIIYLLNGEDISINFSHLITTSKTMTGFVEDDWGEAIPTITVSGIRAIFDWRVLNNKKLLGLFKIGEYTTTELLGPAEAYSAKKYMRNLRKVREGIGLPRGKGIDGFTSSELKRYDDWFSNRGSAILLKFLYFYKSNATLYDERGLPVINGDVVLETDYTQEILDDLGDAEIDKYAKKSKPTFFRKMRDAEEYIASNIRSPIPVNTFFGRLVDFTWDVGSNPFTFDITFNFMVTKHIMRQLRAFGSPTSNFMRQSDTGLYVDVNSISSEDYEMVNKVGTQGEDIFNV